MVVFPNAKINLGLNIIKKRSDGFHDISSCFYPISWYDGLEVLPAKQDQFINSGISIPGDKQSNLCIKAYQLLKKDHQLPYLSIHLHKKIPIGGGLGGGSSDAAFFLTCCNKIFSLGIKEKELEAYAQKLGSDCTFFVRNEVMIVSGVGNILRSTTFRLSGKTIILVTPNIHISTQLAYQGITPTQHQYNIQYILENINPRDWGKYLRNDFEPTIFNKYPKIADIKQELYKLGAFYASMSGTGATVYGLFDQPVDVSSIFKEKGYTCWQTVMR